MLFKGFNKYFYVYSVMKVSLQNIINKLKQQENYIRNINGTTHDGKDIFSSGPYLHKKTSTMSEQDSAELERRNPIIFQILSKIKNDFKSI